jgi:hypothetical protein
MTHESPEFTISGKIGNVLRRPLASLMGVVALFASGCGLSGLDAKPAPATVTVTTTNRHTQTTEAPRATQTVRVTETVTPSPSEPTSRPTKTTPKEGDIVTIGGQFTCADGEKFVGAWVERASEKILKSDWVQTTPTSNQSVVDIKNLPVVIGDKIKFSVGCGGTGENWRTASYTGFTKFTKEDLTDEGLDVTCSPNGNNGRCEVKKK